MCLLIAQTNNKVISKEKLEIAEKNNSDGMGFTYSNGDKLIVEKFREFNKFYPRYKKAVQGYGKTSHLLIHFRFSTHGIEKGLFNVHPFRVNKGLVFAHNGIINVQDDKKRSDTQVFNDTILKQLPKNFLSNKATRKLLGKFVSGSKLAFLDVSGKSTIINESSGHWKNGVWYSNDSYEYCTYSYQPVTYNYGASYYPYKQPKKSINNLGSCSWCRAWGLLVKTEERATGTEIHLCHTCKSYNVG